MSSLLRLSSFGIRFYCWVLKFTSGALLVFSWALKGFSWRSACHHHIVIVWTSCSSIHILGSVIHEIIRFESLFSYRRQDRSGVSIVGWFRHALNTRNFSVVAHRCVIASFVWGNFRKSHRVWANYPLLTLSYSLEISKSGCSGFIEFIATELDSLIVFIGRSIIEIIHCGAHSLILLVHITGIERHRCGYSSDITCVSVGRIIESIWLVHWYVGVFIHFQV